MAQIEVREQKLGIARDAVVLARCGNGALTGNERKAFAVLGNVGLDDRAGRPLAFEQLLGQRVLQQALDGATQRAGAVGGVGAFLRDEL